jgi:Phage phiEco32-like COOH.NH2 ligase-type 2
MTKFTIGCDPELFLKNPQGKFISAVGLIGGNKIIPQKITESGHAILEDNVAVEFNVPPSSSCDEFISHINFTLDYLTDKVASLGLEFSKAAAISFDKDQLLTPESQQFGCESDFNAWTRKVNESPKAEDSSLRSCGGHIHIGTDLPNIEVIRAMDLFAGIPSLYLDDDKTRRQLYGKAGAYRPKIYGVEYRTLSNFWIWSDEYKEWAYRQTEKALDFVAGGEHLSAHDGVLIRKAINFGDMKAAEHLNKKYGSII